MDRVGKRRRASARKITPGNRKFALLCHFVGSTITLANGDCIVCHQIIHEGGLLNLEKGFRSATRVGGDHRGVTRRSWRFVVACGVDIGTYKGLMSICVEGQLHWTKSEVVMHLACVKGLLVESLVVIHLSQLEGVGLAKVKCQQSKRGPS